MAKSFDELLERTTTPALRRLARADADAMLLDLLADLRVELGETQAAVARRLGIKQPSLSKLERQTDMHVSTLRALVAALGGELELTVRHNGKRYRLEQFNPKPGAARKPAKATAKRPAATPSPAPRPRRSAAKSS